MQAYFIVFFGAGLGGCLRHTINLLAARALGTNFPWGTFLINISGSLVMGLIAGWLAFRAGASWTQHVRLFVLTGILGGYTTFSAFSLDAALLYERGEILSMAAYVIGSVLLTLAGVFGGLALVRALS
jgi:CrcB protein